MKRGKSFFVTTLLFYKAPQEEFTTGFREMYRPYVRNVRLIGERYYKNLKQGIHLFFRKFGLI